MLPARNLRRGEQTNRNRQIAWKSGGKEEVRLRSSSPIRISTELQPTMSLLDAVELRRSMSELELKREKNG